MALTEDGSVERQGPRPPWFAGRSGSVLLYRINRRPLANPTLAGGEQPESVMDHIVEVLPFGHHIATGRHDRRRDWILGNRQILDNESAMTGQIGWQQPDQLQTSRYQEDAQEWRDEVETTERSARAPFAFDSNTRVLGILKHSTFSEGKLADVFEQLLRYGENQRSWPTTEWSVEPLLDERDFLRWLRSVDAVTSINLVAKLPNPDALEEFGPVWAEMEARRARILSMKMVATTDKAGLQGLENDPRVKGHIAMGRQGFGYVQAQAIRRQRETTYDQRRKVAREVVANPGSTWQEASATVLETTRSTEALRRTNVEEQQA